MPILPLFSLLAVLAGGAPIRLHASTHVSTQAPGDTPQRVIRTFQQANDGTTGVEDHIVDATATTVQAVDGHGRVTVTSLAQRRHVLIELQAPPRLESNFAGSGSDAAAQR